MLQASMSLLSKRSNRHWSPFNWRRLGRHCLFCIRCTPQLNIRWRWASETSYVLITYIRRPVLRFVYIHIAKTSLQYCWRRSSKSLSTSFIWRFDCLRILKALRLGTQAIPTIFSCLPCAFWLPMHKYRGSKIQIIRNVEEEMAGRQDQAQRQATQRRWETSAIIIRGPAYVRRDISYLSQW
jgi:hypothetical protein